MAERAHGGQDQRDRGHPDGVSLQSGSQLRYPASGVGLHGEGADAYPGRGLRLGQVSVKLQRQHLALQPGHIVKRSRDDGLLPQDESPVPAAWHARRRSACPGPAQLGLGHEPQVGLRAFAVHLLSVLQSGHQGGQGLGHGRGAWHRTEQQARSPSITSKKERRMSRG